MSGGRIILCWLLALTELPPSCWYRSAIGFFNYYYYYYIAVLLHYRKYLFLILHPIITDRRLLRFSETCELCWSQRGPVRGVPMSPVWISHAAKSAFRKVLMSPVVISSRRSCNEEFDNVTNDWMQENHTTSNKTTWLVCCRISCRNSRTRRHLNCKQNKFDSKAGTAGANISTSRASLLQVLDWLKWSYDNR